MLQLGGADVASAAEAFFGGHHVLRSSAVTSASAITQFGPDENPLAQKITMASLGQENRQVKGSGFLPISYRFSQADLGGPLRELAVRFAGVHTPLPEGAQGYLSLSHNGVLVHSQKLSGTTFDLYQLIPTDQLRRDSVLELAFQYTPAGGNCQKGSLPFSASVFNGSYFSVERGNTLPQGFERFPQAYVATMPVFLENHSIENVSAAVQLVMAMQKTTRTQLKPRLVPEPILDGSPLLYIGERALPQAPIGMQPFELKDRQGRALVSFQPGSDFASLQAFGQTLMLAGPQRLSQNLLSSALTSDGWYALSGDSVVQGIAGPPALLRVQGSGYTVEALQENRQSLWQKYRDYWFLLLGLILIAALAWIYPRAVRNSPPHVG